MWSGCATTCTAAGLVLPSEPRWYLVRPAAPPSPGVVGADGAATTVGAAGGVASGRSLPHAAAGVEDDDGLGQPAPPGLWARAKVLVTVVGLGVVDAFGGITATYAAPHIPMFLQTLLQSMGVVWTFLLSRVLVPATPDRPKPRLTRVTCVAYLLVTVGTIVSGIPHRETLETLTSAGWTVVFLLSAVLPVLYNVLQGRFLRLVDVAAAERRGGEGAADAFGGVPTTSDRSAVSAAVGGAGGYFTLQSHAAYQNAAAYEAALSASRLHGHRASSTPARSHTGGTGRADSDASSDLSYATGRSGGGGAMAASDAASVKLTLLTGDCMVQLAVIACCFPLDFTPWFGSHPRVAGRGVARLHRRRRVHRPHVRLDARALPRLHALLLVQPHRLRRHEPREHDGDGLLRGRRLPAAAAAPVVVPGAQRVGVAHAVAVQPRVLPPDADGRDALLRRRAGARDAAAAPR